MCLLYCINHICATPNRCKPPLHRFSNVSIFSPFSAIDILIYNFERFVTVTIN